ncbi:hypothetical protein [Parabacteroides sp. PFB2-10]|uniref:hypothetical protein n=1 Tax=Parabacteroides sp. PFB2-10 TaxID=1742405 RepID=UPI002475405C|nr:hypothetical protein [Parabacteroides sp. PFB2-10]MDL2244013.1 hypothetical protein [Parabacteroides sp. OttesenSCG-928-J18]
MRIQFEIREELADIVAEILDSEKWHAHILEEGDGFKRVSIKDPQFDSKANIEIWREEIHIRTAWSNYTYRIFKQHRGVWCEYIGAYRGLLEQTLLPQLTPKENILDVLVMDSTLVQDGESETLRKYGEKHMRRKQLAEDREEEASVLAYHPQVVYDEYIKTGVPMPPVR